MRLEYVWTQDEYLKANNYHYEVGPDRKRRQVITWVIGGTLIATLLFNIIYNGYNKLDPVPEDFFALVQGITEQGFEQHYALLIILLIYWFTLRRWLQNKMLGRQFKRSPEQNKRIYWDITDEDLKGWTEGNQPGPVQWSALTRVVRVSEGFLFYQGPMFIWMPNKAIQEDTGADGLAELIQRHVALYDDRSHYALSD